jgi:NadR type nicotinamide-nucleotide adenylyltransferase
MTTLVKRVVVTGSECTGKSTLAAFIARHYGALLVHEFVREYAEVKGAPIEVSDHWPIARGQTVAEQRALARARTAGHRLLVLDTDLLSTVTYAHHYTGQCDPGIEVLARERLSDHYLLLDIDVPWRPDGVRDRGDRREEVHGAFIDTLERFGAPYTLLSGSFDERRPTALRVIDELLDHHP